MHLPEPSHKMSRLFWLLTFFLILIGLGFGTYGYWEESDRSIPALSTAIYHAIQLFEIHMPPEQKSISWQLEIGRWAAALAAILTVVLLLLRAFLAEWRLFFLRWADNHVVICGLGEVGTRLAKEFCKDGSKVVAIESKATDPRVAEAESEGITVIIGDAKDPEMLRKARVDCAKHVLAVCSDDDTNIAITVAVRDIAAVEKSAPKNAECLLLLADSKLRDYLKVAMNISSGRDGEFLIKVGGFDMPDMVARMAFEEHPLDFDGIREHDLARVHLVVVGTGTLGEALAVKALQLSHFANRSRLRVSVVGNDAQGLLARLQKRHLHTVPWYDACAVDCDCSDSELPRKVAVLLASDELVTLAICPGSGQDGDVESQNFLLAMAIEKSLKLANNPARKTQILVYLRRKSGFGKLFESMGNSGNGASVYAFGLIETLCNRDTLLHEKQDCLARSMHLEYLKEQEEKKEKVEAKGEIFIPRPAHQPWELLPEGIRESNRLAADHLAIKLRAIGYRMDKPEKPGAIESFLDPDNTLAMMEHERWCAERWLEGWRLGERDDKGKVHNDLKPWDELPKEEKYIDQNFVAKTVRIVKGAKMAVSPISPKIE